MRRDPCRLKRSSARNTSRLEKYEELASVRARPTTFTLNSLEFSSPARSGPDCGRTAGAWVCRGLRCVDGVGSLAPRRTGEGNAIGKAALRTLGLPTPPSNGGGGTTGFTAPCNAASATPDERNSCDGICGAGPTASRCPMSILPVRRTNSPNDGGGPTTTAGGAIGTGARDIAEISAGGPTTATGFNPVMKRIVDAGPTSAAGATAGISASPGPRRIGAVAINGWMGVTEFHASKESDGASGFSATSGAWLSASRDTTTLACLVNGDCRHSAGSGSGPRATIA